MERIGYYKKFVEFLGISGEEKVKYDSKSFKEKITK